MRTRLIFAATIALGVAGCDQAEEADPNTANVAADEVEVGEIASEPAGVTLQTAQKEPFGQYLVDGDRRAVYMLEQDRRGSGGTEPTSVCTSGACTDEWPPVTSQGEPGAGPQVQEEMLSTFRREGGSTQVAYNGWPLYYYHDDDAAGATQGQGVHDQWGGWYLVAPSGEPIEQASS